MKKIEGVITRYLVTEQMGWEIPPATPHEIFMSEGEDPIPHAICLRWKEDTIDPAKPNERELWLRRTLQFEILKEAVFSYEEEPEYPEVDK